MRRRVVPFPSTRAPSASMMSSRTSTSRIRGTLANSHGWSVSMQAAISGNAEFLLPSTATRPESERPPMIFREAMSTLHVPSATLHTEPQVDDLVPQCDAESLAHFAPAALDQLANLGRRRAPLV